MELTAQARQQLETLSWQHIDNTIEIEDFQRLQSTLRESAEARQIYINCNFLHTLLKDYYGPAAKEKVTTRVANDLFLSHLLNPASPAPSEDEMVRERQRRQAAERKQSMHDSHFPV